MVMGLTAHSLSMITSLVLETFKPNMDEFSPPNAAFKVVTAAERNQQMYSGDALHVGAHTR